MMELYYKNETLYIDVVNDINGDLISLLERKLFRIIDDYGVDKIIISLFGECNKTLLNTFKRNYYHNYKGYLLIK